MDILFLILIFLLGASFGSFGNVLIYRLPRNLSIIFPASYCPECSHKLKVIDNIPILSFILLRGRCRYCKENINFRYVLFEVLIALLFSILYAYHGLSLALFIASIFIFCIFVIIFIDLEYKIIPNELSFFLIIFGLLIAYFNPFISNVESGSVKVLMSFLGALTGFIFMWVLAILGEKIFKQESLGGGDIKMLSGLGAILGFGSIFYIIFYASIIGSIVGILLILLKKQTRKTSIAFGPFLGIAAIIWMYISK